MTSAWESHWPLGDGSLRVSLCVWPTSGKMQGQIGLDLDPKSPNLGEVMGKGNESRIASALGNAFRFPVGSVAMFRFSMLRMTISETFLLLIFCWYAYAANSPWCLKNVFVRIVLPYQYAVSVIQYAPRSPWDLSPIMSTAASTLSQPSLTINWRNPSKAKNDQP